MAQAVERILGKDEVGGSSPPISSMIKSPFSVCSGGGDFYFALTRLAKNNAEYRALQNDTEAKEKILAMFNKALESSQNNSTAKNNSAKYALKEYSQHQMIIGRKVKLLLFMKTMSKRKFSVKKHLKIIALKRNYILVQLLKIWHAKLNRKQE